MNHLIDPVKLFLHVLILVVLLIDFTGLHVEGIDTLLVVWLDVILKRFVDFLCLSIYFLSFLLRLYHIILLFDYFGASLDKLVNLFFNLLINFPMLSLILGLMVK